MKKATFYHASCPVCVNAEEMMLENLNLAKVDLEIGSFRRKSFKN